MVNYSFDPTALVAEWPLPDLSPGDRRRIASRLFKAHAAFLRTSDEVYGFMKPMAQAFSGIARVLFHARLLTVELLEKQLRLLVSEAAIAGQWLGRYACRATEEARTEVFAGYLGHASVLETTGGYVSYALCGRNRRVEEQVAQFRFPEPANPARRRSLRSLPLRRTGLIGIEVFQSSFHSEIRRSLT